MRPEFFRGSRPLEGRGHPRCDRLRAGAVIPISNLTPTTNRSVITFAAPPETVVEAALNGIEKAVELIASTNIRASTRASAPQTSSLSSRWPEVSMEECVRLAEKAAAEMWKRFAVPAYLYEAPPAGRPPWP